MSSKAIKILKIIILIILFYMISKLTKVNAIDIMLRVAYSPNLPPYQFNKGAKPKGIHIDILDEIAKENNFIIEYIEVSNTTNGLELLNNGEVDMVMGVTRNKLYEMTDTISQSSICMVANKKNAERYKNNDKDRYYTLAMENDMIKNYAILKNLNFSRYIAFNSEVKALNSLLSGKAELLIGVKDSILYQLREKNQEDNYTIISNYMMPIEYVFLTKLGDEELVKKLNKGLYDLKISGNYEKIYKKWINEDKFILRDYIQKFIYASIVFFIIIAIIIRINLILKKQVNIKTKELQIINKNLELQIIETKNQSEVKNCIIENSHNSIIVFDKNYIITLCNKNAYDFLKTEQLVGRNVFSIDICKYILEEKRDTIFLSGYNIINGELNYIINNIDTNLRYNVYQLYDISNNVRGIILSVEDVTKEMRIKREINEKEKNNTLNKLIASIAHEIRNPLMAIKTFAELIPRKANNIDFQRHMAEFIPVEVDRVNNLIKSLIDYAKPRQNNREQVLINEVINSCSTLINPSLENKNIVLEVDYKGEIVAILDKQQLKQVLINLLINSLDSVQEKLEFLNDDNLKLHIKIKLWHVLNSVYIEVYDEGFGMSKVQLERCTELFYTTKEKGTGIGLALTKQFIEENEGKILIESEENLFTKITIIFGGFDDEQNTYNR